MTNNSNLANEYRALIREIIDRHVALAKQGIAGLDDDGIMMLKGLIARIERKAAAKCK